MAPQPPLPVTTDRQPGGKPTPIGLSLPPLCDKEARYQLAGFNGQMSVQVSAFGGEDNSDEGDVWVVSWDGNPAQWQRDLKVRLHSPDLHW